MHIIVLEDDPEYFYLGLSPLEIPLLITMVPALSMYGDVFFILRIKRTIDLVSMITNLKASNDANAYDAFKDNLRIQGLITLAAINNPDNVSSLSSFLSMIKQNTGVFYNMLKPVVTAGTITVQAVIDLFAQPDNLDTDENYELFLKDFHDKFKISQKIRLAFDKMNPASPFLLKDLILVPYTEEMKIGVFGNLNTIDTSGRGNTDNAVLFAADEISGIGLNFTEGRAQDLFLSLIKFEMQKKLDEGKISQNRFDNVNYSYPFSVPSEALSALDLPPSTSFFEVNEVQLDFKRHKFPDKDNETDAIKLEIILSNDKNETFFQDVFDVIVPNPHVKIYIGFESTGSDLNILIDGDVGIPFNLFTALITAPIFALLPGISLLMGMFGFTIISNMVADKLLGDSLKKEETKDLGFTILKKRWDPFYITLHKLSLDIQEILINENTQVRLLAAATITREYSPYEEVYIKAAAFDDNDLLTEFRYKFSSIEDVIRVTLPATDRIEDFYNITNLSDEIAAVFSPENRAFLVTRYEDDKIDVQIPYSPRFVEYAGDVIASLRLLSDVRKDAIQEMLVAKYLQDEVQKIIGLFLELVVVLVPDYDVASITDPQLKEVTDALTKLVKDSGSYENYSDVKWEDDLPAYLRAHPDEMIILSPFQCAVMGMSLTISAGMVLGSAGISFEDLFAFMNLPGYQIIGDQNSIFVRNSPNDTRSDNLSTLPEF